MSSPLPLRLAKLAYVGGMLALAAIGTLAGFLDVHGPPLFGVEEDAKRPLLTASSVYDESFQHGFIPWFEQHWGLRSYAVKTDNTLVERVFGESRRTQNVFLGERGITFPSEDLAYANRDDGPEASVVAAERMARVQRKFRGIGKTMILVVIPAKTSLERDAIPERWKRKGVFGRSDENLYGTFVRTLRANDATFVDGRELLSRPEYAGKVFTRTGRHWRMGPACDVLAAALDLARPTMPSLGDTNLDCRVESWPDASIGDEDFDLFRLRNTWDEKPADVDVLRLPKKEKPYPKELGTIPTLFVGSSFTFKFVRIASERGVLHPSLFYYYDRSVVETNDLLITGKVVPFSDGWRKDTFDKELFIVSILETFLPVDEESFFSEVEKAIDRGETWP